MTIDNILKRLEKEQEKLESLFIEDSGEAEFFKNFLTNNSFQGVDKLVDIDLCELLIAYICCRSDKIDFKFAKPRVYSNEIFLNTAPKKYINKIFQDVICSDVTIDDDEMESLKSKRRVKQVNDRYEESFKEFTEIDCDAHVGILDQFDLLELLKKDKDTVIVGAGLITSLKGLKEDMRDYQFLENKVTSTSKKDFNKQMSKICKMVINEQIEEDYKLENIYNILNVVQEYGRRIIKMDKQKKKTIKTNLSNYKELELFLKKNKDKEEITQIPAVLSKIESEEIRIMVLMQIYVRNELYYNKLEKEYNELSTNSINKYKVLFNKYNLDLDKYEIDFSNDINEIEEIINKLNSLNITDSEEVISILNVTNINTVNSLYELMSVGYIEQQLLLENRDLFNKFGGCTNLYKNIELLQSRNLSVSNIKKMQNILIKDPDKIGENIKILEEYELFKYLKKTSAYDFLDKDNLENILDTVLELGFEKLLKKDLSILNNNEESWKKIIILNKLNIFTDNIDELNEILNSKNVISEDSKLDDYIFDISKYREEFESNLELSKDVFLNALESEENTNYTYNLNGTLISKNKVKRNLENLEGDTLSSKDIFNVIVSNKILDNDEYQNINDYLFSKNKQLVKK